MALSIGIVGGGINGMCTAWQLAQAGHAVRVYERNTPMSGTSSASSKLLHGGLRYLENFEFRLVKEALHERNQWLQRAPHLAKPLELLLPVYKHSRRSRLAYGAGLKLYDMLSASSDMPASRWKSAEQVKSQHPQLQTQGLLGAFAFWDGQMDDLALGLWVTEQAQQAGVQIKSNATIDRLSGNGSVHLQDGTEAQHDAVVNAAGPWAEQLAQRSGIQLKYQLDLVRGSHLLLSDPCKQAWLLEVPDERRIFFVLPYKGQTLLGTTEVRHALQEPVKCSAQEQAYLLAAYKQYFPNQACQVVGSFAGLRPLIKSAANPTQATREYAIEQHQSIITILGGKWTTAMALANKVRHHINTQHQTQYA
jgi:glycerol-3-phosphate dehydrogenase